MTVEITMMDATTTACVATHEKKDNEMPDFHAVDRELVL